MTTDQWDVIIVGAGGSGLAASIEAARQGAKVLVIEKGEKIGGTTGWSVGSFTSSLTPHQLSAGIQDHPDHHFEDLGLFNEGKGDSDNLALRRILVDASPDTLKWLMELGVVFVGPNPEPPHRVPRMHNVVPSSASFGYHLIKECNRLGIEIICNWKVVKLSVQNEKVTGVVAVSKDGVKQQWHAQRGVILAAGDFAGGHQLKSIYLGPEVVKASPVNELSTGDGISLGQSVGGFVINAGHCNAPRMRFVPGPKNWIQKIPPHQWISHAITWGWKFLPSFLMRPFLMKFITTALGPEPTLFKCGAVLIDSKGQQVEVDFKNIAHHLALRDSNLAYIVFDSESASKLHEWPNFISTAPGVAYAYLNDYKNSRKDVYYETSDLGEMALYLKTSVIQLKAMLTQNKQTIQGPFYALGPVRAYVTITEGGLAINSHFQVIKNDLSVIRGLYAAGSNGQGGVLLEGHGHHIGWAFVSGRLAGRSIMSS